MSLVEGSRRARAIMVQGTNSNAGKSFVTAALCRVFKQDGYRVAPFKAQNMALNSFITKEGLEMGRAQAMQAEACGIEPTIAMNPILVKPMSRTASQIIVQGEVIDALETREYYAKKSKLVAKIRESYDSLASQYDIIVIEGAGSPAEINIKKGDFVNMGMAKLAKAPVLLVGDIERGGVFASLAGTVMLLDDTERPLVKGLIINKFRGDKTLLGEGGKMIEDITKVSYLGCMEYIDVDIDDEDSLSERLTKKSATGVIDVAILSLPYISNFTDFNALERLEGVSVRYVEKATQLCTPDLLIIPGSKNTMGDLKWIRATRDLEQRIIEYAKHDGLIIGICGGYQILGQEVLDPENVEEGGAMKGLGLLPAKTVFSAKKRRTQVVGTTLKIQGPFAGLSNLPVEGYEIHMGQSTLDERTDSVLSLEVVSKDEGAKSVLDGAVNGNVLGAYVHGFFDTDEIGTALTRILYERKGLEFHESEKFDVKAYKEEQYNKLAALLRESLDVEKIYQILNEGVECPDPVFD